MNRFLMTTFAIPSLFGLLQGCSLNLPSKEASTQTEQHQTQAATLTQHSGSTDHHHHHHQHHQHDHHQHSESITDVKLTKPANITVNQPQTFTFEIVDKNGERVTDFEVFQEELMHLIIVSDDLEVFDHLHPEYDAQGLFKVDIAFPQAGDYTLVSDYMPKGSPEQVSLSTVRVPGTRLSSSVEMDQSLTQTVENTAVSLSSSQPVIKSGENITLKFNLKDAQTNQPINDLEPYLGEKGHLVIFRQSEPLTKADYIHAHALENTPDDQVHFMTQFPQPGNYKVWGQFKRNGQIVTASFWLEVS